MSASLGALLLGAPIGASGGAPQREHLDVRLFASLPRSPEGLAVDHHGRVFAGTGPHGQGEAGGPPAQTPSEIYALRSNGSIRRRYEIRGQDVDQVHATGGMAFDRRGLLYIVNGISPSRIVRLDPKTGRQTTYARFRDVPPCPPGVVRGQCSDTTGDAASVANYLAFARDGSLFVTDHAQALIWRVPVGGGKPRVWFSDRRLEAVIGPNGISFLADGRTLLFAQTFLLPTTGPVASPAPGALYKLRVGRTGRPGRLRLFWKSGPFEAPDSFAVARSGKVYVALSASTANQLAVLSRKGRELARLPAGPAERARMSVPPDNPASIVFLGKRLLVTNQAYAPPTPRHWGILDVFAGERGLPLFRPVVRRR